MPILSLNEIFETSITRTQIENFAIFEDNFGNDDPNFLPFSKYHEDKAILNIDNFVDIIVKYNMNKNVLDLIDFVESKANKRFTHLEINTNLHKFHFSPNMFVKFCELKGSEELLKKIALRTIETINNKNLFEDILYCSILCGNMSNSLILHLFKTNKFCIETNCDRYSFSCRTRNILDGKMSMFMHIRTHILCGIIPENWKRILDYNVGFEHIRFNMYKFYEFVSKINSDLDEKKYNFDRTIYRPIDKFDIGIMCKELMNSTYNVMNDMGYVFPESNFKGTKSDYFLSTGIKNIVSFCYASCLRLMCEMKEKTAKLPVYITQTLKNIYKTNPKSAKIITENLIMFFLENDITFDKNALLYLSYKIYDDAINIGPIVEKLVNNKLYDYCEAMFKYFHNYLKSSIYTDLVLKKILCEIASTNIEDDTKIQLKSLCITILETGVKNDDDVEKLLNDIGIKSEEIKWSWRWSISENFDPNALNDKHESLFEEAYLKNKQSSLKKIMVHRKFRPMTSSKNIIDIVINDDDIDKDYKKYILGKLLQTSIVLKSEQVKKITEIGIDVYKTLQKRICISDDRIVKLEDNLEKVSEAFALAEERNDIIQERLRLMEQREYKIVSFLQMMCMQYTSGNESNEVVRLLTDIG